MICETCYQRVGCDIKPESDKKCSAFWPWPVPPGYKLVKRPDFDCSCIADYPNVCHRRENGHWKCVDDYEYVGISKKGMTHCRRKKND